MHIPPLDLDRLRRAAKQLLKDAQNGSVEARARLEPLLRSKDDPPKLADCLHVVARDAGFVTWPALKEAVDLHGMDRAAAMQRLKLALFRGQLDTAKALLAKDPGLGRADLMLAVATFDVGFVRDALAKDPSAATRPLGVRTPLIVLSTTRYLQIVPEAEAPMLDLADALLAAGADVNDSQMDADGEHPLSALYFALTEAKNLPLATWLLENGATPNDNESLYHATETRDLTGLKLLLDHGAVVDGTNALLRAIDFDDVEAVRLLIEGGGSVNGGFGLRDDSPDMTALTHAARRLCGPQMAELLLDAGVDPTRRFEGLSAYELALLGGLDDMVQVLEAHGADTPISAEARPVVAAIAGQDGPPINADTIPKAAQSLLHDLIWKGGRQEAIERLVARGMPWDAPDWQGLTPVQTAGWHGNAEAMEYFLRQKPDLGHINGYGGTLLSTILHGAENAASELWTDHVACLRLALHEGVAIPRRALTAPLREDLLVLLREWAEARPGAIVEHGVV